MFWGSVRDVFVCRKYTLMFSWMVRHTIHNFFSNRSGKKSTGMAIIKKIIISVGKDVEKWEPCAFMVGMQMVVP